MKLFHLKIGKFPNRKVRDTAERNVLYLMPNIGWRWAGINKSNQSAQHLEQSSFGAFPQQISLENCIAVVRSSWG